MNFRATPQECEFWKERAREMNLTFSDLARKSLIFYCAFKG